MVSVAQLVERWIVVPVAEGSNPSTHPTESTAYKDAAARLPPIVPKSVLKPGRMATGGHRQFAFREASCWAFAVPSRPSDRRPETLSKRIRYFNLYLNDGTVCG
jgi:hypothetical protein